MEYAICDAPRFVECGDLYPARDRRVYDLFFVRGDNNMKTGIVPAKSRTRNGSAILTALLLLFTFSLIGGSLLTLTTFEGKMSRITMESWGLLNAAEGGVDRAVHALNSGTWTGWQFLNGGQDAYWKETSVTHTNGGTCTYRILIQNYTSNPTIYSSAYADLQGFGGHLEKQIRATYNMTVPQPGGMIAKEYLKIEGSGSSSSKSILLDAYDSSVGPPSSINRTDGVTLGTVSGDLEMKNTRVFGYVRTGGKNVKNNGGNKVWGPDFSSPSYDSSRVSKDFSFDFPAVVQPSWSMAANTNLSGKTKTIGTAGFTTLYRCGKISLGGGETLTIQGDVQVYASDGVDIGGGGKIRITTGSSLEIYTHKDVSLQGQAIINADQRPSSFKVYGTNTKNDDQTLYFGSQANVVGVFYSPHWKVNISLDSAGAISGSVVGNTIEANSEFSFHYDTTLGASSGGGTGIDSWMELVGVEQFDFITYVTAQSGSL